MKVKIAVYQYWGLIGVFFCAFSFGACDSPPSSQQPPQAKQKDGLASEISDTAVKEILMDSTKTRSLDANARLGFDFAKQFPLLDSLSQSQSEGRRSIGSFAAALVQANSLETSEQLEELLFERRDQAREQLQSLIENQDSQWLDQNYDALEGELNRLGMSMLFAEGTFIGLGNTSLLSELVQRIGSDALRWYLQFIYASDQSANGEYPFLDMSPYSDMIVAGEQLKKLQPNSYFEKIESQYQRALLCMADIHRVGDPNARTEEKQLLVGGVNTETYPFATGAESRQAFARGSQSQYSDILTKILGNVSEMSANPESLYVILTEWVDGEKMAKSRVFNHLEAGTDIPHYLKIRRTNGSDAYAIVYRFYDDADKAEAAISKIEQEIATAELHMVSVRNGELYEMASAMN